LTEQTCLTTIEWSDGRKLVQEKVGVTMTESSDRGRRPAVALVTGATSGIGQAAAIRLAEEGHKVIVHGRDRQRGAEVVKAVEDAGSTGLFLAADLGDTQEVARLAAEAGEVDVLVNNAGSAWFGPSADLDVEGYDGMFDANVRAAYFLVAALAPGMARRGSGSIINLGSMVGQIGVAGGAAYGATKAALAALTRAWAAEFSPSGVRVNTVAPGPVYTAAVGPERTFSTGKTTLLGRAAESAEIADVIAFLASPRATYITGAVIPVDGGRTAV
jgi:NAD(P)-dependent dehydrogenase (short-subunit alcohol dehydrogenase family)